MLRKFVLVLAVAFALSMVAFAQTTDDFDGYFKNYSVDYFTNRNNPQGQDQFVNIINPGTIGSPMLESTAGGGILCANLYVFDRNEELAECCSCKISADGLLQLSVNVNLTANPLTGVSPNSGVIKLVSTIPVNGVCDAEAPFTTLQDKLLAWGTHLQMPVTGCVQMLVTGGGQTPVSGTCVTTEREFQFAPLSAAEAAFLPTACNFAAYLGSGKGICSCS